MGSRESEEIPEMELAEHRKKDFNIHFVSSFVGGQPRIDNRSPRDSWFPPDSPRAPQHSQPSLHVCRDYFWPVGWVDIMCKFLE